MGAKVGTIVCLCDDIHYLPWVVAAVRTIENPGPITAVVSKIGWDGSEADYKSALKMLKELDVRAVVGSYRTEQEHRLAAHQEALAQDLDRVIIPDSDEVLPPELLKTLHGLADQGIGDRVYCNMETMWYSPEYRINPPERLTPIIMYNPKVVKFESYRNYTGGSDIVLSPDHGLLLHLAYCQPPGTDRIEKKTTRSTHAPEFRSEWKKQWALWPQARTTTRAFHPTHETAFWSAERRPVPEQLADVPLPPREEIVPPKNLPRINAIIPVYGHPHLIARLAQSLVPCRDLLADITFIDDNSPDDAIKEIERQIAKWTAEGDDCPMRLIKNAVNHGFGYTSNRGIEATEGEMIALINTDVVMTRPAMIRLIESISESGTVAAVGPVTNHSSQHQAIEVTYTSLENMPLFAEDQAMCGPEDKQVDMLVAFMVLMRRSALNDVGLFDERFKGGNFEDNDLSCRFLISDYKMKVCGKAFVHHDGSVSLNSRAEHPAILLGRNEKQYIEKYKDEIDCGYLSGLPGMTRGERIKIDPSRKPSAIIKELKKLQSIGKITLGIICKNEERVIADLLRCVTRGGFYEIIIVDTGSTDRTVEICRSFGIEPAFAPWDKSFSKARNECIRLATGDWFLYLDCDDTMSLLSILQCLQAAINAPPHVIGFMMDVQFVGGLDGNTVVDHAKLFRLLPGVQFKYRIHEQIYSSLSAIGGEIRKLVGPVVLHSGYDTSPAGQAAKRERDWPMLRLDHEENPGDPYPMFCIGMTHAMSGEDEPAIPWLRKAIDACTPGASIVRGAYSLLGQCLAKTGKSNEAIATFEEGLLAVGEDPELRFKFGKLLSDLGRHAEAREQYELIAPVPGLTCISTDSGILGPKRLYNLGHVHFKLGDYPNARATWRRCIAEYGSGLSAIRLAGAALEMGDVRTAREAHAAILELVGPCREWVEIGMAICDEREIPRESFLRESLSRMPYAVPVLECAVDFFLSQGREGDAFPYMVELDRLGVIGGTAALAILFVRHGRYVEALEKWESVLARDPEHEMAKDQVEKLRPVLANEPVS